MSVAIHVKIDDRTAPLLDELSRRDGGSGRNAVMRKALDRLIESELDEATRRRIAAQVEKAA